MRSKSIAGASKSRRAPTPETERHLLARKHEPHLILAPALCGTVRVIGSSAALPWRGLLLEKYASGPGERPEGNSLDRPVVMMLCSPTCRGEHKAVDGTFSSHSRRLGALSVVPKGPVPAGRSSQKFDLLCCAFDESFVSGVRDEVEDRKVPPLALRGGVYDHAVSRILNLLFAEVESDNASGALYADSLAHALTTRLLFLGERPPPQSRATGRLSQRKLLRVRDLIESCLDDDLTLQDLATETGYSRSHFLRVFHATTGMTPHRYLLQRRIERARRLLEQPDISIAEVAYSCGFSSQAHLTVAFRKACGVTPAEYRRRL
jgi:AraC family transcriptional regulator